MLHCCCSLSEWIELKLCGLALSSASSSRDPTAQEALATRSRLTCVWVASYARQVCSVSVTHKSGSKLPGRERKDLRPQDVKRETGSLGERASRPQPQAIAVRITCKRPSILGQRVCRRHSGSRRQSAVLRTRRSAHSPPPCPSPSCGSQPQRALRPPRYPGGPSRPPVSFARRQRRRRLTLAPCRHPRSRWVRSEEGELRGCSYY